MEVRPHKILIVRLGAMGDILHALPALSSLRLSYPEAHITWVTAPKWAPLLTGNPAIGDLVLFRRSSARDLIQSWKVLRGIRPDLAIDIQGLIQSALVGRASRPSQFWGWEASAAREPLASRFYTHRVHSEAVHVIDRNLDLIRQAGATSLTRDVYIPSGRREGSLPASPFVLVHPFAGWASKQWPLENYGRLASALASFDVALVANVPPQRARELTGIPNLHVHSSSLEGLIGATRDAVAVVGLDSGPMHLADALGKPGVALFGPTDPTRNGPYGGTIRVLRAGGALTTYKRNAAPDLSMTTITVHDVLEALLPQLQHSEPRV